MPRCASLLLLVALAVTPVLAQPNLTVPRTSPYAEVHQRVGLTDLAVTYHRPAVNDRELWGGLVPYGQVWRAGANENTVFTTSSDITVAGQPLPAGRYGLHLLPQESGPWTLIFSTMADAWGSFSYDEAEDALRVAVTPREGPHQERLQYTFENPDNRRAELALHWGETVVPVEIGVDSPAVVLANMERELRGLPGFFWQGWNQIATFALQQGHRLDDALGWADRSIGINVNATNRFTKAEILAALGRDAEAEAAREEAFAVATEADVNQYGYVLLGRGEVDRAIEVFQRNVDAYPESWNVYDSLAEAYAARGDTDRAIELYERARSMAPAGQYARIDGVLATLRGQP
ncbi:MAG: DUF2911 domain-containing protein [Rhodothermales bacterium]|nr:DUF2911 domain-containing protein [Rhodothermales bacterium]